LDCFYLSDRILNSQTFRQNNKQKSVYILLAQTTTILFLINNLFSLIIKL